MFFSFPFVLLGSGEISHLTRFVCLNWFVGYPDTTGCKAYTAGFPSLEDSTSSDAAEGTANGMDPPDLEFPICEPATGIDGQSSFNFYFLKINILTWFEFRIEKCVLRICCNVIFQLIRTWTWSSLSLLRVYESPSRRSWNSAFPGQALDLDTAWFRLSVNFYQSVNFLISLFPQGKSVQGPVPHVTDGQWPVCPHLDHS